jgi:hypothetical protein
MVRKTVTQSRVNAARRTEFVAESFPAFGFKNGRLAQAVEIALQKDAANARPTIRARRAARGGAGDGLDAQLGSGCARGRSRFGFHFFERFRRRRAAEQGHLEALLDAHRVQMRNRDGPLAVFRTRVLLEAAAQALPRVSGLVGCGRRPEEDERALQLLPRDGQPLAEAHRPAGRRRERRSALCNRRLALTPLERLLGRCNVTRKEVKHLRRRCIQRCTHRGTHGEGRERLEQVRGGPDGLHPREGVLDHARKHVLEVLHARAEGRNHVTPRGRLDVERRRLVDPQRGDDVGEEALNGDERRRRLATAQATENWQRRRRAAPGQRLARKLHLRLRELD